MTDEKTAPASKRYLLFASGDYYPSGGWSDCEGGFSSVEDAVQAAKKGDRYGDPWGWWHVIDSWTFIKVARD